MEPKYALSCKYFVESLALIRFGFFRSVRSTSLHTYLHAIYATFSFMLPDLVLSWIKSLDKGKVSSIRVSSLLFAFFFFISSKMECHA